MPEPTEAVFAEPECELSLAERRSESRRRRPCSVRLLIRPDFQVHRALLRDVSPRGIGVLTEQPFAEGAVLAVLLQNRHTNVSGILTAQVRHATVQSDGTWLIGCSLSRRLAEKELRALL